MHACARIGAIHSVVFGGFSAPSLQRSHRGCRGQDSSSRPTVAGAAARARLKAAVDQGARRRAARAIETVIVYRRTGKPVTMEPGRDLWWHEVVAGARSAVRAGLGRCRTSVVSALHLRLDRQAQGHSAFDRRLPARGEDHLRLGIRRARRRCVLVHRRCGLGDRPQLRGLRTAGARRDRRDVRRCAHLSGRGPLLEDLRRRHGVTVFYTAPTAIRALMKLGDEVPAQYDLIAPAPSGQRRRAHQSRRPGCGITA